MRVHVLAGAGVLVWMAISPGPVPPGSAGEPANAVTSTKSTTVGTTTTTTEKEAPVTSHARGSFDVKLAPIPGEGKADTAIGRMSVDKRFHGDLEGTSRGQMLSAGSIARGSAGYVAMEEVTGTLGGRSGTFVLMHHATMIAGVGDLTITVVPESGTGPFAGITGKMSIEIKDGNHFYDFEYSLQPAH